MSVEKFNRNFEDLFNWDTSEQPTTEQEYQNAVKNWTQTEMNLVDTVLWQPETAYSVGNIAKTPSLPSQYILVCTEAGDSGVAEPDYTGVSVGDTVVDGTATWLVSTIANGGNIDALTTAVEANTQAIGEHSTAIAENTANVATNTENIATNAENIATNTEDIANNTTDIEVADKRISNIEKLLQGNLYDYQTDTDSAYTKTVPAGAMPYAGIERIGGKTVVWNQLIAPTNAGTAQNANAVVTDGVITCTVANATQSCGRYFTGLGLLAGHKYFMSANVTAPYDTTFRLGAGNTLAVTNTTSANAKTNLGGIITYASGSPFVYGDCSGYNVGDTFSFEYNVIDLTLLFGSGNEPSTVEEFKAMFPAEYYPYNAGELLSAGVTSVVSKGKNIFNKNAQTDVKSVYRYYPVPIGATQTLHMTFVDKDTSVSLPNDFGIGFVKGNSGTATNYRWVIRNGAIQSSNTNIDNRNNMLDYVFIFPNTQEAFDKLTSRYDVCVSPENSYSPYMSATYPIPASIQSLEGYGWSAGSVYNYIDYERKVFVKNVGRVDLGTIYYSKSSNYERFDGTTAPDGIKKPLSNNNLANIISSLYVAISAQTSSKDMSIAVNTNGYLRIYDSARYSNMTSAEFRTAMNGVYLYYELETPVETDISAYLSDDNLIEVEPNGTLTFPNSNGTDYQIPVPSSETYMVDLQSAI